MTKDEMNRQLLQQVNSLTSTVDSLNVAINAQAQLTAQLNQTIQELKEQLNKNSLMMVSKSLPPRVCETIWQKGWRPARTPGDTLGGNNSSG